MRHHAPATAVQSLPISANERVKKMSAESSQKPKTYHFYSEWEKDFYFPSMSYSKYVCLICQSTIAIETSGGALSEYS